MSIAKTISTLALAISLTSTAVLWAATECAIAKSSNARNSPSSLREVRREQDRDEKSDRDRHKDRDHKQKDRESKHKDKGKNKGQGHADNKCGGKKKKCPTPIAEPIRHPGGGGSPLPVTGTGTAPGSGTFPVIGTTTGPGASQGLGDPGYNRPPGGTSSGGSGAGSPGGPSRDPVENGSGTTIKPY